MEKRIENEMETREYMGNVRGLYGLSFFRWAIAGTVVIAYC